MKGADPEQAAAYEKRRDEEWESLKALREESWDTRNDCSKGIRTGLQQSLGWQLVVAEHLQNRLDNIVLRNEMLFACDWFRAQPPCPFRIKAKEQDDGSWCVDAFCAFHSEHPMDEAVEVTKPVLKMGNPDGDAAAANRPGKKNSNGSNKSSHHNSRAPSPSSDDYDTGLYRNYQAALPKGSVKRKRRDLSPPPSSAYPYDDILKSKHTEDPNASKLPRLGQKYKSKEAFDRACAKGTPEDADWLLGNATAAAADDEVEKKCKHQSGRMCTGDNFRVRCEQQQDGTWYFRRMVVRAIYLHDVGISAVFDDSLETSGRSRFRSSLRGTSSATLLSKRPPSSSHEPSPAPSTSSSQTQRARDAKKQKKNKSHHPLATSKSSSSKQSSVSEADESFLPPNAPGLSVMPYKDPRATPQPADFLMDAAGALPDMARPSTRSKASTPRSSSHRTDSQRTEADVRGPSPASSPSSSIIEQQLQPSSQRSSKASALSAETDIKPDVSKHKERKSIGRTRASSSESDVKPVLQSPMAKKPVKEHQIMTDFLNGLSPPTDNDHGLGDLVGKQMYDAGYKDERSLLKYTFVPDKFQSKCDRDLKLQSSLSDYELSLMKHHVTEWLVLQSLEHEV